MFSGMILARRSAVELLVLDVRYAMRSLRRSRAFTAAAVLAGPLVLVPVAVAACLGPALRAAATDPNVSLRGE
jgi:hypothetical protein